MQMMKKPRTVLVITAVILLGMLLGSYAARQEPTVPVTAARAECRPIYNSVTASGTVESAHSYTFTARQNAVAGKVSCATGETIRAGQPLWQLSPTEDLRWTADMVRSAAAALIGETDSEAIETALSGAPATVYAPADCTLTAVPSEGQPIQAGLAYAQAIDLEAVRLRVNIAEAFIADVQAGQRANITVSATGGVYAGRVESVAPVARQAVSLTGGSGAVTVSAVLRIVGADESLRPGYSASAKIFVDEKESAVILPYEAIRQEGREEIAYVIGENGRISRRAVTTGYALSQAVEVTSGIAPGELVVLEAAGELADGVPVEVRR